MKINENRFSAQIATVFINWPLFWLLSGVKWDEKECMQLYVNRKKPIIYFQSHFNLSSCVGWFLFFLSEWICHKSATFTQIVYSFFFSCRWYCTCKWNDEFDKIPNSFSSVLLFVFCCLSSVDFVGIIFHVFISASDIFRSWAPSFASLPFAFWLEFSGKLYDQPTRNSIPKPPVSDRFGLSLTDDWQTFKKESASAKQT